MCKTDLLVQRVAASLGDHCLRCHLDFNNIPAPKVMPYCRRCGAETPLFKMLNGGFGRMYQRLHGERTLQEDRKRFCDSGAHNIFMRYGRGYRPWHFCPLCGKDLNM